MRRLLTKWLRSIGSSWFALLIVVFVSSPVYSGENHESAAKEAYKLLRQQAGSQSSLKRNLINPLLGGQPLYTLDRSQSGSVKFVCPSSSEFLTVLIRPKGTGDFDADIYWDSNMDGRMDRSITVSNVSGVCTNGFISCTPGTWTNCRNYIFDFQDGNIVLREEGLVNMAGCFCVNQSCGSNLLWSNIGYVLRIFGGAVAGAFQKADSRYAISDARIDGTAIYFYGQQTRDCSVAQGGSGVLYPERYWNSPSLIYSSVENLVSSQSQDPNSFYRLLQTAYIRSQASSSLRGCVIRRTLNENRIRIEDIISPVGGDGGTVRSCGERCIQVVLGREGNNYWCARCLIFQTYYDLLVKRPDLIERATIVRVKWDDWIQIWFNDHLVWNGPYGNWTDRDSYPPGSWELETSWDRYINKDVTSYFTQYNTPYVLRTLNRVAVSGCGEGFSVVNIITKTSCESTISIESTCNDFENNQNCVLWDEFVDNVQTVRQGIRTGLAPIKQAVNMCDRVYVFDWLVKNRTYLCKDQPIDLSDAKRRLSTVTGSLQFMSNEVRFTDVRKERDVWVTYPNQRIQIDINDNYESCEKACRVKVPLKNAPVALSGRVTEKNSSNFDNVYYYRSCQNNICPTEEGEVIDIPCQCMNDFGAASTMMQTIRLAGQDMICTSGNIKALPGY